MLIRAMLMHSTAQHSTAQHSTAQHSTAQVNCILSTSPYITTITVAGDFQVIPAAFYCGIKRRQFYETKTW